MNRPLRTWKDHAHALFSWWGACRHWWYYRSLTIVAVTGTDGKSSTVLYTARLLRQAGIQTAHYSSVTVHDSVTETPNEQKMTTPGHGALQSFLGRAARVGARYAVIEVTSEGIKQWRHVGIPLTVVVITNIYPEHIERHGSFEYYRATKLQLLKSLRPSGVVVMSSEDKDLVSMVSSMTTRPLQVISVPSVPDSDGNPYRQKNLALASAVIEVLRQSLIPLRDNQRDVRGRFEILATSPRVIVDYAHTPQALELCLQAVRHLTSGRVIHVFGAAGGGRDTWKRPRLAEISERYADIHILTEENSFDEPVTAIIADIQQGFSSNRSVEVIPVREEAVRQALAMALPGDTVICTAKGSETVIAGPHRTKRPYNEREFILSCLA